MANIKFTDTLTCTAKHGILAKAKEIYDDNQSLDQTSINKYGFFGTIKSFNDLMKLTTSSTSQNIIDAFKIKGLAQVIKDEGNTTNTYLTQGKDILNVLDVCSVHGFYLQDLTTRAFIKVEWVSNFFVLSEISSLPYISDKQNNISVRNVIRSILLTYTKYGDTVSFAVKEVKEPITLHNVSYEKELSYNDLKTENAVKLGSVYLVRNSFTWKGKTYDAYSPVEVVKGYSNGNFTDDCILPLCTPAQAKYYLTQGVFNADADSFFDFCESALPGTIVRIEKDIKLDFGVDTIDINGTYISGSCFLIINQMSTSTESVEYKDCIIPLSPTKEKLMWGVTTDTSSLEARITALENKLNIA